jgi:HSP20 family protein
MAENVTKLPVRTGGMGAGPMPWMPFEGLRREMDRLFDSLDGGFWRSAFPRSLYGMVPFGRGEPMLTAVPAVDVTETDKAYEIMAEMPGMDEKNVEVSFANGILTIKGEKKEDKEETKKDYYLKERTFGSYQRAFQVPDMVDADKIEATFLKGVLTIRLPKSMDVQKATKKIEVKAA